MPEALDQAPYRDASLPLEQRIEDLLDRMSPEEKIAQLGCVWSTQLVEDEAFSTGRAAELLRDGTGQVTRIGASTGLRPQESAAFMNAIQRHLVEQTRLGIPAIVHEESTGGFTARDADQLPQGIGLASTWDPALVEAGADLIRQQMLAVGARQTLAPVLDIARDPRWGRVEETYGEDPYLASRMGVAYVRGVQGGDLRRGVAATAKHFLGYGLSEGGHNHRPAHIGPRELREVFARPFLAAIQEADLASVMNAYNDVDGLPCGGSKEILDDLLRGELGFEGLVVADYFTVMLLMSAHRVAADKADAAQMALEAGLDVELPATDCYAELAPRLASGQLSMDVVDRSVRRVLRLKLELGLFEEPYVDEGARRRPIKRPAAGSSPGSSRASPSCCCATRAICFPSTPPSRASRSSAPARTTRACSRATTTTPPTWRSSTGKPTQDPDGLLPRSEARAHSRRAPGSRPRRRPSKAFGRRSRAQTRVIHAGLRRAGRRRATDIPEAVAPRARLRWRWSSSADARAWWAAARAASFATPRTWASRASSSVSSKRSSRPGRRRWWCSSTAGCSPFPGSPRRCPPSSEAWLPGEEGGGAIADLLFGSVNPSGRLPVSLPHNVGQLPVYHYQKWAGQGDGQGETSWPDYNDGPAAPLFPFGHGLSYTRFEYSGSAALRGVHRLPTRAIEITFELSATRAERAGEEVVQLYLQDPVASVTRPLQQLAGFARIALAAGERGRLRFTLDPSQLAFYDRAMKRIIEPGKIEVRAGASSRDIRLSGAFRIEGDIRTLEPHEIRATRVEIE